MWSVTRPPPSYPPPTRLTVQRSKTALHRGSRNNTVLGIGPAHRLIDRNNITACTPERNVCIGLLANRVHAAINYVHESPAHVGDLAEMKVDRC